MGSGESSMPMLPPEVHNLVVIVAVAVLVVWVSAVIRDLHRVCGLRAALETRRIVALRGLGHRVAILRPLARNHLQALVHTRQAHPPKPVARAALPAMVRQASVRATTQDTYPGLQGGGPSPHLSPSPHPPHVTSPQSPAALAVVAAAAAAAAAGVGSSRSSVAGSPSPSANPRGGGNWHRLSLGAGRGGARVAAAVPRAGGRAVGVQLLLDCSVRCTVQLLWDVDPMYLDKHLRPLGQRRNSTMAHLSTSNARHSTSTMLESGSSGVGSSLSPPAASAAASRDTVLSSGGAPAGATGGDAAATVPYSHQHQLQHQVQHQHQQAVRPLWSPHGLSLSPRILPMENGTAAATAAAAPATPEAAAAAAAAAALNRGGSGSAAAAAEAGERARNLFRSSRSRSSASSQSLSPRRDRRLSLRRVLSGGLCGKVTSTRQLEAGEGRMYTTLADECYFDAHTLPSQATESGHYQLAIVIRPEKLALQLQLQVSKSAAAATLLPEEECKGCCTPSGGHHVGSHMPPSVVEEGQSRWAGNLFGGGATVAHASPGRKRQRAPAAATTDTYPSEQVVTCVVVIVSFEPCAGDDHGPYTAVVERQLVGVRDSASRETFMYSLGEVYGLEDESGSDCVICLTEEKAFMLLPCRHLCVCKACFRHIDKCPVCRSAFDNYLQVDPAPPPPLPPAAAAAASAAAAAAAASKGAHQGQPHATPLQPIRVLPATGGTVLPE